MAHRDHHRVVAPGNRRFRQTVALGAQHHRQLFLALQGGVAHADGTVIQRHGGGLKAQGVQRVHTPGGPAIQPRPRDLKYRTHTYAHGAAVQRVAASGRKQHAVHAQRCRAAENRADVGGIHNVFQHGNAAGVLADLSHRARGGAAHGAQHTAGQRVAGQLLQHRAVGGIHRHIGAARQHGGGRPRNVRALH